MRKFFYYLLLALVVVLVGIPVITLLLSAFKESASSLPFEPGPLGINNFRTLLSDPKTLPTLWNTLTFSLVAIAIAFVLAVSLSFLVDRTDLPHKGIVYAFLVASMAMPGMLTAMAWTFLVNPNTGLLNLLLRNILGLSGKGPILPGLMRSKIWIMRWKKPAWFAGPAMELLSEKLPYRC